MWSGAFYSVFNLVFGVGLRSLANGVVDSNFKIPVVAHERSLACELTSQSYLVREVPQLKKSRGIR